MRIPLLVALAGVLSLTPGCTSDPAPVIPVPPPAPAPPDPDPVGVTMNPHADGHLLPIPPAPDEGLRGRRRMDIDQLDASIQRVTGGIAWTEGAGIGGDNLFVKLASTLGKPDFLDITQEDLSVSLLFTKFLGDAARSVCGKLVQSELSAAASERVLMVFVSPETSPGEDAAAIEANMRYLLLRYHGQDLAVGDAGLSQWSWLFESTLHVSGNPATAWQAVCVALITHPDFYSY
jgi:hypothetical protein